MAPMSQRSVPTILTDLLAQFTSLLRKEGELARTEVSEKIGKLGNALMLAVIGAVLVMPALVVLLLSAVAALEEAGMAPVYASLVVGGGVLLIGIILLLIGYSQMRVKNMVPDKTIHQLQEDASFAKHQLRTNHEQQRAA